MGEGVIPHILTLRDDFTVDVALKIAPLMDVLDVCCAYFDLHLLNRYALTSISLLHTTLIKLISNPVVEQKPLIHSV